ncbi:MAG: hypothetical protein ABW061_22160 [Polyangiaceae bacterium]
MNICLADGTIPEAAPARSKMETILGLFTLLLGFFVIIAVGQRNREIASILMLAFALRTGLTLVDSFVFTLPGAGDGIGWHVGATYMSKDGVVGTFQYLGGTGHVFYRYLMSFLYALFVPSALMIKGLNVLFGTLLVKSTWELSLLLGGDSKRARTVAWVMTLCPSLMFFSSVLLREVAVTYPLVLSIVFLIRWYQERRSILIVQAVAALIISMTFHSGGVAVLLFGGVWLVGNWFRSIITGQFRNLGRNTLALAIGGVVVFAVLSSGFALDKFNGIDSNNIDTLTGKQTNFAHGRAAYLEDLHAGSPVDLLWQAPIRIVYFLFAPFPWMIKDGADAFGLLDSMLFVVLTVYAVRNRRSLLLAPRIVLVLGVFAALALVFALGVSNYGTALRHRNKMLPLLVAAVISIPVERRKEGRGRVPLRPPLMPRRSQPRSATTATLSSRRPPAA